MSSKLKKVVMSTTKLLQIFLIFFLPFYIFCIFSSNLVYTTASKFVFSEKGCATDKMNFSPARLLFANNLSSMPFFLKFCSKNKKKSKYDFPIISSIPLKNKSVSFINSPNSFFRTFLGFSEITSLSCVPVYFSDRAFTSKNSAALNKAFLVSPNSALHHVAPKLADPTEIINSVGSKTKQASLSIPINSNLCGFDYVEILCSNAKQSAYYYESAFGFQPLAYGGLETGQKDRTSYILKQGDVYLVLTSSLVENSFISNFVRKHGDGVHVIGLKAKDAKAAFDEAVSRGARVYKDFVEMQDEFGIVKMGGIYTFGDTVHMFVERSDYKGAFLPGYMLWNRKGYKTEPVGLTHIDHTVANVELGRMSFWKNFYEKTLDLKQMLSFDENDVHTDMTALRSVVMSNDDFSIKIPINEPAKSKKKSQIAEFLDFYNGAGCQHIAFSTNDITATVAEMTRRGCEFLKPHSSYYDTLAEKYKDHPLDEDINVLKKLGILVDSDKDGYLLQIFTRLVSDRPTLFYEIIQRKGSKSFGKNNFNALFLNFENEQKLRGTLD